jgi:hypothetical protein
MKLKLDKMKEAILSYDQELLLREQEEHSLID